MTEHTPVYTSAVELARRDHALDELNLLMAARNAVITCANTYDEAYRHHWRKMTEAQQNRFYANVRDFRLRLEALTCVEEVA